MLIKELYKGKKIFLSILFLIITLRIFLPYLSFSSTDLEGLSQKYLYIDNSINIYNISEVMNILPYFPFVINIYFLAGKTADLININYVFIIKYIALSFEFLIAFLIIKFYQKKKYKFKETLIVILSLFLINPLAIYITSFSGFFETLWIFFLLLAVYIFEFEKEEIKNFYIPIFLAISVAIKPVGAIFIFYFFYKNSSKTLFFILFFITTIFLNLFFIIGNLDEPLRYFELASIITSKFVIGAQVGQFGLSEIEKIYNIHINFLNFSLFKIIKIIEIILIFYIYIVSLQSKKIKPYEFIFSIFFVVLLLNDNLHNNYLYWIIPFAFLINIKKAVIISILFSILVIEMETREDSQLILFNYPNILDFFNYSFDIRPEIIFTKNLIFNSIIFYLGLIILFDKKIFFKFKINIFNFKVIKKIFFETLKFKKIEKLNIQNFLKKNNYNICLFLIIFLSISQFSYLKNVISSNNENFEEVVFPPSLHKHETHGYKVEFKSNFYAKKIDNLELVFATGYFSTAYVNGVKISSIHNILHFIHKAFAFNRSNKSSPIKKFEIKDVLQKGENEIKIVSSLPHSMKDKFGLIFLLTKNGKLYTSVEDLNWRVTVNTIETEYQIINFQNHYHYRANEKLLDNYLSLHPKIKILNYEMPEKNKGISPFSFLIYIFFFIFIINLYFLRETKNFK